MSTNKYGLTTWDEELPKRNKTNFKPDKDLFMTLENGSNEMRIVSKPHRFYLHKFKVDGMAGWGVKINCAGTDENGNNVCPICKMMDDEKDQKKKDALKPVEKYKVAVLSRKENRIKVLEIGQGVFKDIKDLNDNKKRWGNPELYDIDITVNKSGVPKDYYKVNPLPPNPSPLTMEEIKMKEEFDFEVLQRLCVPPKPEKVAERVKTVLSKIKKDGSTLTAEDDSAKSHEGGDMDDVPDAA